MRLLVLSFFILFFVGCGSFFAQKYGLDILEEKRVQATRKDSLFEGNRLVAVAVATNLNQVSEFNYHGSEYFFIEIFSEIEMDFSKIEYLLNGTPPSHIYKITKDKFDEILKPVSKWSHCYLVVFNPLNELESRNMVLRIHVSKIGEMKFDFSVKITPLRL